MPKMVNCTGKKEPSGIAVTENEKNIKKCQFTICDEESVASREGSYILSLCGTQSDSDFRIAVASSDYTCTVYSVGETIAKVTSLDDNESPVVGIKFSPICKNILYTATRNGVITARDLRVKRRTIAVIRDHTPDGKLRPFCSFDASNDDRLAVAGSEHTGGDAFILFWDLRYNDDGMNKKSRLLGGYWESHIDDITSLSFHPKQRDFLASGSTDGLINVFDLRKSNEESALRYSLNTESSVDRLGWLDNGRIWCTTHTHQLQLWDREDAQPYGKFDREALGKSMNCDSDTCYVVRIHDKNVFGQPFLLTGSTSADAQLYGLSIEDKNLEIVYDMPGNKQLVRDSWYHEKTGCLVTGGEKGILNLWRDNEITDRSGLTESLTKFSRKKRDKQSRPKPY